MGIYKYLREAWKKPMGTDEWKSRLFEWRRHPTTLRIEHPTRLDRARALGYKAKQGIIVVRQRIPKNSRQHTKLAVRKRRTSTAGRRKVVNLNYKAIAEARAQKKYKNMEVLNSYWVAQDGRFKWYEIILVDRDAPSIKKDKQLSWVKKTRGRVFRGLTSTQKKSRGLHNKGLGAEKVR